MNIEVQNMHFQYQQKPLLYNIHCHFSSGKITSILGSSGAGKSTLLNIIAGLEKPDSGIITYNHKEQYDGKIAYMSQKDTLLNFKTVFQNLVLILEIQGVAKKIAYQRVDLLLHQFHIEEIRNFFPHQLSGGLAKRVSIARQQIIDSPILLLDEPFATLDIVSKQHIQKEFFNYIKKEDKTLILVTHDIKESIILSDKLIILGGKPTTVVANIDLEVKKKSTPLLQIEEEVLKILEQNYQTDLLFS